VSVIPYGEFSSLLYFFFISSTHTTDIYSYPLFIYLFIFFLNFFGLTIDTKIITASSGSVSGRLEKREEAEAIAAKRFASSFWLLLKK
jgi:hypothetical protein